MQVTPAAHHVHDSIEAVQEILRVEPTIEGPEPFDGRLHAACIAAERERLGAGDVVGDWRHGEGPGVAWASANKSIWRGALGLVKVRDGRRQLAGGPPKTSDHLHSPAPRRPSSKLDAVRSA
jgi:hypothetical protein